MTSRHPPGINRGIFHQPPRINRRITVPTDHPPGINLGIYLSALDALTRELPDIPQALTGGYSNCLQASTGGLPFRQIIPQALTGGSSISLHASTGELPSRRTTLQAST
ncbi:hypothetical protein Zmor_002743 [Zophobas morio]|uniref:Uncharacterized protein n=1 Tax=Zophobas morio TaxID=2755281 RepID=A0AA38M260_9CUCU|nr:hypothetical protein Zmor_002743 [Zophobas morio]